MAEDDTIHSGGKDDEPNSGGSDKPDQEPMSPDENMTADERLEGVKFDSAFWEGVLGEIPLPRNVINRKLLRAFITGVRSSEIGLQSDVPKILKNEDRDPADFLDKKTQDRLIERILDTDTEIRRSSIHAKEGFFDFADRVEEVCILHKMDGLSEESVDDSFSEEEGAVIDELKNDPEYYSETCEMLGNLREGDISTLIVRINREMERVEQITANLKGVSTHKSAQRREGIALANYVFTRLVSDCVVFEEDDS